MINEVDYENFVRGLMGADKGDRASYALGLAGEAGEVCDLLKKHWGHGHVLQYAKLRKELGDVLWYVTALGLQFGLSLQEIAEANVAKLSARYPNGFSSEASIARADVSLDDCPPTQRAVPSPAELVPEYR
jgi:NTP pyrophosphatase (non-canonical NTP hydrolase)